MRKWVLIPYFPLLLISTILIFVTHVSAASCARQDIKDLLEASRGELQFNGAYFPSPKAVFFSSIKDGREIQWIGAKWDGPVDGALFAQDCAGNNISVLRLGGVIILKSGPVLPTGKTVEVAYISGVGSGIYETTSAIASIEGSSIKILWQHASIHREAFGKGYDYVDTFQWKYSRDGKKINVKGRRRVGPTMEYEHGWPAGTTHALPSQNYCWNAQENLFQECD
ncbi:MAG: hypothetical protein ACM31D_12820 [Bacteroidota bacterium]